MEYGYAASNGNYSQHFRRSHDSIDQAQGKAAVDKEVASLRTNNVYALLPMTAVPTGQNIIGSRWVYKINAYNPLKERLVELGWRHLPGVYCGSKFALVCRLQCTLMVLAIAAEYNM